MAVVLISSGQHTLQAPERRSPASVGSRQIGGVDRGLGPLRGGAERYTHNFTICTSCHHRSNTHLPCMISIYISRHISGQMRMQPTGPPTLWPQAAFVWSTDCASGDVFRLLAASQSSDGIPSTYACRDIALHLRLRLALPSQANLIYPSCTTHCPTCTRCGAFNLVTRFVRYLRPVGPHTDNTARHLEGKQVSKHHCVAVHTVAERLRQRLWESNSRMIAVRFPGGRCVDGHVAAGTQRLHSFGVGNSILHR